MPNPEPLRDVSSEHARQAMVAFAPRIVACEWVSLNSACGRVLKTALVADRDQPPFDAASTDGFAFTALGKLQRLTLVGASRAGMPFERLIAPGEAIRICAGAALPQGADTVLPSEAAVVEGETVVGLSQAGAHVRRTGCDFVRGEVLLPAHHRIRPSDLSLAAAAGAERLWVSVKPRIAIIANGNELVRSKAPLANGKLNESISAALAALVARWGGRVTLSIVLPDEREAFAHTLAEACRGVDLAVVIRGPLVGECDFPYDVLGRDARLVVEKIAIRPGRPTWFGAGGSAPVLGLPGNPVSAVVAAVLFLRPLLYAMLGLPSDLQFRLARLAQPLAANGDREHFLLARRVGEAVTVLEDQDCSLLFNLHDSNCLIRRAARAVAVEPGAEVEILNLTSV